MRKAKTEAQTNVVSFTPVESLVARQRAELSNVPA